MTIAVNKSISDELDIIIHVLMAIVSLLWRHQQTIVMASAERRPSEWDPWTNDVQRSSFLSSFIVRYVV